MLVYALKLFAFAVHCSSRRYVRGKDVNQAGETSNVIKVRVGQKNIQTIGLQVIADTTHASASIENDADFREHDARCLSLGCREIAAGSQKNDLHRGARARGT